MTAFLASRAAFSGLHSRLWCHNRVTEPRDGAVFLVLTSRPSIVSDLAERRAATRLLCMSIGLHTFFCACFFLMALTCAANERAVSENSTSTPPGVLSLVLCVHPTDCCSIQATAHIFVAM